LAQIIDTPLRLSSADAITSPDKPATGYSVQRSADDLLETLDALGIRKAVLIGTSCAGQVQTLFAAQHSDRLSALVYFDDASDPTIAGADVNHRCRT
jgi:pimeloyl-ACP methyl ester carboxylesterase